MMSSSSARCNHEWHAVHSGCLLTAWQTSSHGQRKLLLDKLVVQLHAISEEVAQALPVKDTEPVSFYDRFCTWVNRQWGTA